MFYIDEYIDSIKDWDMNMSVTKTGIIHIKNPSNIIVALFIYVIYSSVCYYIGNREASLDKYYNVLVDREEYVKKLKNEKISPEEEKYYSNILKEIEIITKDNKIYNKELQQLDELREREEKNLIIKKITPQK